MSADGGAKKIFISHASDDPDWPETAVRAVAVKLRQRGVAVLLDYWHEQDVIGHKLPLAEWRQWMRQCLDEADHVLCLCSDRYAQLAHRADKLEPAGRGVALEAFEIEKRLYNQKQHNRNWCWILKLDTATSNVAVPHFLQDRCPEYGAPAEEGRLVREIAGTQALVVQEVVVQDDAKVPVVNVLPRQDDALDEQRRLVGERLALADSFWQALCRDLQRQQPAALAGHDSFVRWLSEASADDAEEVMFAARRALEDARPKTGATAETFRLAELAAVSVFCLAVCRLVDVAALGTSYRFPTQAKDAATLYCAVLATVLCGGRLELSHSHDGRTPRPAHAYDIRVPCAGDHGPQVFDQALFQALCADSPNAPEAATLDSALTSAQRAEIRARIRTIRRRERHALTLVLHDASHQASADAFSQDHGVPVFVCDPEVAAALIGMTAEELAAEIQEMWRELRYCNRHPSDEKHPDNTHAPQPA